MRDALKVISIQLYREFEAAFYLKHLGPFQQGKRKKISKELPFQCPGCGEAHRFCYHGFF
ncbi:MAG: hypothetical protein A7315_02480 [Candidatus Altiarchaeales archaeon WOR_SM1_79]|nr:MAG: hypothetical protein A7315_02480 [Candidatus Altiarchaeales archaeon WOR_SM1_79]